MPIRLFVVDDSAVMRQGMAHLLRDDREVVLAGSAPNPIVAMPMIRRLRPDVLLLDVEMPGMDGLTFLRRQMAEDPIPTVICSTLTVAGGPVALEALSAGAVSVVTKPRLDLKANIESSRRELVSAIRAAAASRPRRAATGAAVPLPADRGPRGPAAGPGRALAVGKPVVIGSSTGGVQAVESILSRLPADAPGIAIVQHMPAGFTRMWAERVDGIVPMSVREATDGARLERGVALVAPGGRHLELRKVGGDYHAVVKPGPPVNRHAPSVDVLFRSAAAHAGSDALGILLTGMGDDGARGMKALHDAGARTVAQDEATCIVFGMPKEAIALGAVDEVLPIDRMADAILQFDARG
ncbi:MAG: chemotaxis response regulator protein-glutamate methylesterase [Burkholderiales bacterium]|nr:chemotaxis response regulator protein-glutamate methylesterase [Burkholderiales bacterium]